MKRKITFLTSIFMIAMILFTSNVFAAETFTHEGSTYVIDEVKLKLDSSGDELAFSGMDENNNYVMEDVETEIIYKVNDKECAEMSMQEILDFMYYSGFEIHNYEDNLNIYQEKNPRFGWFEEFYFETEDETVNTNKTYYERVITQEINYDSDDYKPVNNPDLANGTYYEKAFFVTPKSANIDENTYYEYSDGNLMVKVENPKEEEIYKYSVIGDPNEYFSETKIGQITQEVYDKIFTGQSFEYYIHYDEVNKEIYFLVSYDDTSKSIIYKADGTIVAEYNELMLMSPLSSDFFMIAKCDENREIIDNKVTIIDTNGNKVFEAENIPYLETLGYGKYTTYLKDYDYDTNKFYNMYEYKLLSEDNQKYEGKDLQIQTSGELDRLTSVKVNGTELDASNYTKTSGSTVITLKNDYLKTLELGTYTLELGYVDGTKIETKFIVDKIYSNDVESEGEEGNTTDGTTDTGDGTTDEGKNEGEKDNTPGTGSARSDSILGLYITIVAAILGVVLTRKK